MTQELRSACPIAASLDILGDRWTLLILRDMLFDDRVRFSEMAANESIATNILSDRLRRLVRLGLIEKVTDPDDGRRVIYLPLQPAIDLMPVLAELVAWGIRYTQVPDSPQFAPLVEEKSRRAFVKARMKSLSLRPT